MKKTCSDMPRFARLIDIATYLPDGVIDNFALSKECSDWSADAIYSKLGIRQRHISAPGETALDLGEKACHKLFDKISAEKEKIEALIFCTQSADYALPPNSCLLQHRLQLSSEVMAFDIQHGCSGYAYGVSLAKSLIESGQVKNVLFVTAETYSKHLGQDDCSVRTLFGDAGAASFFHAEEAETPFIDSFVFDTDGGGAHNLILPDSGQRTGFIDEKLVAQVLEGGHRTLKNLYMNGPEIFMFTLSTVPKLLKKILSASRLSLEDIDLFVFHQANSFMLEHLAGKCGIPQERFYIFLENVGNTVSCSIPLALEAALKEDKLTKGDTVLLLGFGVGFSSAGGIIRF